MAIPVLTPQLPNIPLPSDVMTRIAGTQKAQAQAAFEAPLLAAQLRKQQQATRLAGQLAPLQQELISQQIATQLQNRLAAPAKLGLVKAETAKFLKQAQDPLGGQILPGPAGQAQGIQILMNRFGVNSPVVQRALASFEATKRLQNARADFYSSNVQLKNLPQLRKNQILNNWEEFNNQRQQQGLQPIAFQDWSAGPGLSQMPKNIPQDVQNHTPLSTTEGEPVEQIAQSHPVGSAPVFHQGVFGNPTTPQLTPGQVAATPQDFASEAEQTRLNIAKEATDPQLLRKWVNLQNITKIMNGVDPTVLARYTGPEGLARMARDRASELAGRPIPGFAAYNNFVNQTVPNMSDTIRQTYGTSITPEMFKVLKRVSNPITWKNSPDLAISEWNQLKKLMQERQDIIGRFVAYTPARGAPTAAPTTAPKGITQEDLEFTARKKGLTVEQVKQQLGIK